MDDTPLPASAGDEDTLISDAAALIQEVNNMFLGEPESPAGLERSRTSSVNSSRDSSRETRSKPRMYGYPPNQPPPLTRIPSNSNMGGSTRDRSPHEPSYDGTAESMLRIKQSVGGGAREGSVTGQRSRVDSLVSGSRANPLSPTTSSMDSERTRMRYLIRVMGKEIDKSYQRTQAARDVTLRCKDIVEELRLELGNSRAMTITLQQENTQLRLAAEQAQGQMARSKLARDHGTVVADFIRKTVPAVKSDRDQAATERARLQALVQQQHDENVALRRVIQEMAELFSLPSAAEVLSHMPPPTEM
eukprot:TRINITY_DN161_c0_g1_i2.p1 TRINITY_DN161_c0_g1~~TRINITY_DN161_c0_g1_i2.p1  ORF type:complete len:312 (-),score=63.52 TRINITY_DN161_c0_g1_i2:992-1903(-)